MRLNHLLSEKTPESSQNQAQQSITLRRLETSALRALLKQAHALDNGSDDEGESDSSDDGYSSGFASESELRDELSLSTIEEEPEVLSPSWFTNRAPSTQKRGHSFFNQSPRSCSSEEARATIRLKIRHTTPKPDSFSVESSNDESSLVFVPNRNYAEKSVNSFETFTPHSNGGAGTTISSSSLYNGLQYEGEEYKSADLSSIAALLRQAAVLTSLDKSNELSLDIHEALSASAEALEEQPRDRALSSSAEINRLREKFKLSEDLRMAQEAERIARWNANEAEEQKIALRRKSAKKAMQVLGSEAPVMDFMSGSSYESIRQRSLTDRFPSNSSLDGSFGSLQGSNDDASTVRNSGESKVKRRRLISAFISGLRIKTKKRGSLSNISTND